MKKTLAYLLALLIITSSCLASCKGDEQKETGGETTASVTETNGAESTAEPEYILDIPDTKYDGYEFRIFVTENQSLGYVSKEGAAEKLSESVYKRNKQVEDKFGITLKYTIGNADGSSSYNSLYAGEDQYDFLNIHGRLIWSYIADNLGLEWTENMTHVNLDNPWWDHDIVENLSLGGDVYVMSGDIDYMSLGSTNCMIFNKDLCDNLMLEYPYADVKDGSWTFDKFYEYVKAGTLDLNTDGVMDFDTDRFGYATAIWVGPINILYTSGQRLCNMNDEGFPEISWMNETVIDVYTDYFEMVDAFSAPIKDYTADAMGHGKLLAENRAMFVDMRINCATYLRDSDTEFGIIPYPKYTENDEYASNVDAGSTLILIPFTTKDTQRTSAILEYMGYASREFVRPVYYDTVLTTRNVRDDESAEMVDIILANRVFDFGYYGNFCNYLQDIGNIIAADPSRAVASTIASYNSGAIELLESFLEKMGY